ncbi:MAG: hydrolase TatD, partial [Candidatus Portiera sp.]|nr:hydrolase TatD [Portiera sp.]
MHTFDICANLTERSFAKDLDDVLDRAYDEGVQHILIPGSNLESSQQGIELASSYRSDHSFPIALYNAVGYHPHNAKEWNATSQEFLAELVHNNSELVRAIGECGLDYNRNFSEPKQQQQVFIEQLELARSMDLPVFLHERDAHQDFLAILKEHKQNIPRILVHCFTGNGEELEAYLDIGCYIGITGWFCDERRGAHLQELVSLIPSDKLLIETDAPYLLARDLPEDKLHQGNSRRNEPAYLPHLVHSLAECLSREPEHLAQITLDNS